MIDRRLLIAALGVVATVAGPVLVVDHLARGESPKAPPAAAPDETPPKPPPVVSPLDDLATKIAEPAAAPPAAAPEPDEDDFGIWVEIGLAPPPTAAPAEPTAPTEAAEPTEPPAQNGIKDETPQETLLADREEALARTHEALLNQMKTLQELQKQVEVRWKEADALMTAAGTRWKEKATLPTPGGTLQLPPTMLEANTTIEQVVAIVKKMKPKAAAAMVGKWDDPLAVDVIGRMSARAASPVLAALPAEQAARVTRLLARAGLPTPLPEPSQEEAL